MEEGREGERERWERESRLGFLLWLRVKGKFQNLWRCRKKEMEVQEVAAQSH